MKDLMIRCNEPLPVVKDWSQIGDILVYTRLTHDMKLFLQKANENHKKISGQNPEAIASLDSYFTGANL